MLNAKSGEILTLISCPLTPGAIFNLTLVFLFVSSGAEICWFALLNTHSLIIARPNQEHDMRTVAVDNSVALGGLVGL